MEPRRQGTGRARQRREPEGALQKSVQNLLADAILASRLQRGDTAVVDVSNGKFWMTARHPEPVTEPANA